MGFPVIKWGWEVQCLKGLRWHAVKRILDLHPDSGSDLQPNSCMTFLYSHLYDKGDGFVDAESPSSSNIPGFYGDFASGRWWAMIARSMGRKGNAKQRLMENTWCGWLEAGSYGVGSADPGAPIKASLLQRKTVTKLTAEHRHDELNTHKLLFHCSSEKSNS